MTAKNSSKTALRLGLASAIAAAMLSGCAGGPAAQTQASRAGVSPQLAEANAAVGQAERDVAKDPRNPSLRLALGDAYLDAGRFASAETSFTDAMDLGDASPRAALSLALAQIAQAKYPEAATLLNDWGSEINKADLGLALSLAGQPERGIHIMSNAIRGGENTVKMRQNLAYAFAMAGRWREARLMAQQDLPAGEVDARLEQWAGLANADAYQRRVAGLLGVPAHVADAGQPVELALNAGMDAPQFAAVEQFPSAVYEGAELAALGDIPALSSSAGTAARLAPEPMAVAVPAPTPVSTIVAAPQAEAAATLAMDSTLAATPVAPAAPSNFAAAFAQVRPATSSAVRATANSSLTFVSNPVVQELPQRRSEERRPATAHFAAPANSPLATSTAGSGTSHLVQLGSFASEAGAHRAWDIYVGRFPELANHDMVISEAVVRGKRYWRVSAGGFDRSASQSMCRSVRSSGSGCISWAANSPPPGAVNSAAVQLARR